MSAHVEKSVLYYLLLPPVREAALTHCHDWMFAEPSYKALMVILKNPRFNGIIPATQDLILAGHNDHGLEPEDLHRLAEVATEVHDRPSVGMTTSEIEHAVHSLEGFIKDRLQARGTELIATATGPESKRKGEVMWAQALNFTISTDTFLDFSDPDVVEQVRALDGVSTGAIIKSNFSLINKSALAGGYKYGDLVMVAAKPGGGKCHAKGAQILMRDGTLKLVEDVVPGDQLMGPDGAQRTVRSLARGRDQMWRVTPAGAPPYVVNSAHVLHLAVNFKFFTGQELTARETANLSVAEFAAMPADQRKNFTLIRRPHGYDMRKTTFGVPDYRVEQDRPELLPIEALEPVGEDDYYGFEVSADHLYMTAEGIVHHNSTTMCAEGAYAIEQGFKVCHVFLGDMSGWDSYMKYLAYWCKIDVSEIENHPQGWRGFHTPEIARRFANLRVKPLPADVHDVYQVISKVNQIRQTHKFDMLIVDYDANIRAASGGDGHMYNEGGNTYANLKSYSAGKCATLIGSQIKTDKWDQEIIPMEAAAESSKKPHHVDMMLTLGVNKAYREVGTLNIAKMRRGKSGVQSRIFFNYGMARPTEITPTRYQELINLHTSSQDPLDPETANPGYAVPGGDGG
jgi:hypothetical protein